MVEVVVVVGGGGVVAHCSLLLHEQIFDATVRDVFFAPLHSAPLDLLSPHFYRARQPAIDARLASVAAAPPTRLAEMVREDGPLPQP